MRTRPILFNTTMVRAVLAGEKTVTRRCGWDANPWVWVIEFERVEPPKEEKDE